MPGAGLTLVDRVRIFAPSVTPFTENGSLDVASLARHVARLAHAGVGVIATTTVAGEAMALTLSEHRQIYETAVGAAEGRVIVCAAIRESRTSDEVRALMREAAAAEVDALLIEQCRSRADSVPTEAEQERYWCEVLEHADRPVYLSLDTAASGGYYAPPALIGRLAEQYRHVTAICLYLRGGRRTANVLGWEPSAPFRDYRSHLPTRVGIISDLESLQQGALGTIQAAGNVLPRTLVALAQAWDGGSVRAFAEAKQQWERWAIAAERWACGPLETAGVLKALLREVRLDRGVVRAPLMPRAGDGTIGASLGGLRVPEWDELAHAT